MNNSSAAVITNFNRAVLFYKVCRVMNGLLKIGSQVRYVTLNCTTLIQACMTFATLADTIFLAHLKAHFP